MKRKLKYGNIQTNAKLITKTKIKIKIKSWTDCTPSKPHIVRKTIGNMRRAKRKILHWYHDGKIIQEYNDPIIKKYKNITHIEGLHPIIWKNYTKINFLPLIYFGFILIKNKIEKNNR